MPGSRRLIRCALGAIATVVVVLPSVAHAREPIWTRVWGSKATDFSYGLALDAQENSVVVGSTDGELPGDTSAGLTDGFIRSYDPSGALRWSDQFGTAGYDDANDVVLDASGNAYIVGRVNGAFPGQKATGIVDTFVRKYDTAGNEIWTRQFGFPNFYAEGYAAAVDDSGNVYAGGTNNTGAPLAEFVPNYIRKYDPDGNELWTVRFGHWPSGTFIVGMTFVSGTLYVAGDGPLDGGQFHGSWLKAFAPDGTELWTHVDENDFFDNITSNADGRIAISGSIYPATPSGFYVATLDTAGNVLWRTEYSDDTNDLYHGLAIHDDGTVFLGATKSDDSQETGVARVKRFDPSGHLEWTYVIDRYPPNSVVTDLAAPASGALYIAGAADGQFAGARGIGRIDAYLVKLNQVASCADTSRPTGNEEGIVSSPVHQTVEPLSPDRVAPTVHEVNCTVVDRLGL